MLADMKNTYNQTRLKEEWEISMMILEFLEYSLCEIAKAISLTTLNSTCFFASYQPDIPEELKGLEKH